MEKVTLTVEKLNGIYTVNGKKLSEMNAVEQKFLNDFFIEFRRKDNQILIK